MKQRFVLSLHGGRLPPGISLPENFLEKQGCFIQQAIHADLSLVKQGALEVGEVFVNIPVQVLHIPDQFRMIAKITSIDEPPGVEFAAGIRCSPVDGQASGSKSIRQFLRYVTGGSIVFKRYGEFVPGAEFDFVFNDHARVVQKLAGTVYVFVLGKSFQKTDGLPEFSPGIDEITEFFMPVENIPWNGGVLFNVTRPADIVGV
ncbi:MULTISPECIES: hypothetical protein [Akkermansia]|uniref:hypothetical protein n=2 Tax=Akkermansia TaxID=239934 RepID=UPI001F09636F|nr:MULTISPECIES: hypothetical protein [Akkermansia]MEE0533775.1 hypothetical protein [Akkermansia sp.]